VSVGWDVYLPLSLVMFLEYAVWGAWMPVLAARLLGPLGMSGKQAGWIYATLPLACIVAPLVSGQLADSYFEIRWILGVAHLIGTVLLVLAAWQRRFWPLFLVMFCYSFCYAATLPLVNAILFDKVHDVPTQSRVFIWAPVAWALAGYCLTAWRWVFKTEKEGRDCLIFAALLSLVTAACCFTMLPGNELARTGEIPIVKAFSTLANPSFLLFMIVSLVGAGMMQFYFLGSARFMQDIGIAGKNVPGIMGLAQAVQAAATWFLLSLVLSDKSLGYKWTLVLGTSCWVVLYLVYLLMKPKWLVAVVQGFHGLAYVFFMIAGQIYAEAVGGAAIRSSMQALIFAATTGVGLFLGTQLAGFVMDRSVVEGKFQWRRVWTVPAVILAICAVLLAIGFQPSTAG